MSEQFIASLGLQNNPWTTQIEPHDYIAEISHALMRFNQILLDLTETCGATSPLIISSSARWRVKPGSSTMPHKINPIDLRKF